LKKVLAGFLFLIGFILSPLSWWNDILVNIPLAYALAIPFGKISKEIFPFAFVFMYLLTNVVGMVIMRRSALFLKGKKKYTKKQSKMDVVIIIIFTILIFILVKVGVIPIPYHSL